MKNPIARILVLILSIGLAAGYVWYSSKKGQSAEQKLDQESPTKNSDRKSHQEANNADSVQGVENLEDVLMNSSKVARFLVAEDVQKLVEEKEKSEKSQAGETKDHSQRLLPSTKNPARLITPSDIDKLLDLPGETKEEDK